MAPRLTVEEKRLLRYPPTPSTWVCQGKRRDDGERCEAVNNGLLSSCWLCGAQKSKHPVFVWPRYVAACQKAGVEPDMVRWKPEVSESIPTPPKRKVTRR